MQQRKQWVTLAALLLVASYALADTYNVDNVVKNFEIASTGISAKLVTLAKQTVVSAALLQWTINYSKEIFGNHDAKDYLGKGVMLIMWFGISIGMIEHVDFMAHLFKKYASLAGDISGVSAGDFTPWGVVRKGKSVVDATHAGIAAKLGGNWWAFGTNFLAAGALLICDVIVIVAFMILGLSLFVVNVEFWLIFAVTPLALALIPLSAMRDQGIAPLKGLLSVGLRVLILGVIIAVAQSLSDTLIAAISANGIPGDPESGSVLSRMMEYHAGMLGCAAMAIYSGKIASAIASGSATFTGSDAMAAGGAMVAGGAAMYAGAAAVGGAALSGASGAKGLASAASNALSKGASNPFVSPSGGAIPGAGNSGIGGFGQPLQNRPAWEGNASGGANNGTSASGVGATGASNQEGGDSGGGTPEASNAPASIGEPGDPGASNWEKFGNRGNRLVESLNQDQANVSVSVNLGVDR